MLYRIFFQSNFVSKGLMIVMLLSFASMSEAQTLTIEEREELIELREREELEHLREHEELNRLREREDLELQEREDLERLRESGGLELQEREELERLREREALNHMRESEGLECLREREALNHMREASHNETQEPVNQVFAQTTSTLNEIDALEALEEQQRSEGRKFLSWAIASVAMGGLAFAMAPGQDDLEEQANMNQAGGAMLMGGLVLGYFGVESRNNAKTLRGRANQLRRSIGVEEARLGLNRNVAGTWSMDFQVRF